MIRSSPLRQSKQHQSSSPNRISVAGAIGTAEQYGSPWERQSVRESWQIFKDGYSKTFQEIMAQFLEPDAGAASPKLQIGE
jgi:hypothetical protein